MAPDPKTPDEMEEAVSHTRTDRELLLLLAQSLSYIRRDVTRLTTRLDTMFADHEKRIRVLENFRWWILGGAAGMAFLGALAARAIWH